MRGRAQYLPPFLPPCPPVGTPRTPPPDPRGRSHPGIRDRNLSHALVHPSLDLDPTSVGRELERVGQEVQDHLLHLALVTMNHTDSVTVADNLPQSDSPTRGALTHEGERVVDGRA